jgi:hypothetical protein
MKFRVLRPSVATVDKLSIVSRKMGANYYNHVEPKKAQENEKALIEALPSS